MAPGEALHQPRQVEHRQRLAAELRQPLELAGRARQRMDGERPHHPPHRAERQGAGVLAGPHQQVRPLAPACRVSFSGLRSIPSRLQIRVQPVTLMSIPRTAAIEPSALRSGVQTVKQASEFCIDS